MDCKILHNKSSILPMSVKYFNIILMKASHY
jgi:hypothetical protein